MIGFDDLKALARPASTKIVLLVMDGVGGLPRGTDGKTELDAATTPHLDALAARASLGRADPVAPGFTNPTTTSVWLRLGSRVTRIGDSWPLR
jgi:2,3-bisphosphoglycerate-independent phosphoglycerate mutase